jgi:hypothetical protein
MARLKFVVIAAVVLLMVGCPLFEQQENFISFTWDGMQYLFTAGAGPTGNPCAVAYPKGQPAYEYIIRGSATPEEPFAGTNTIVIDINANGDWAVNVDLFDDAGFLATRYLGTIPQDWIDNLIRNRDEAGAQFAGSIPGPSQGSAPFLENIVFSVERLPNIDDPAAN